MSGVVHLWPKDGQEEQRPLAQMWNGAIQDLLPGITREYGAYADPVGFFRNFNDGDYRIWWTLGALKSNSLHFIVKDGKATLEATTRTRRPFLRRPRRILELTASCDNLKVYSGRHAQIVVSLDSQTSVLVAMSSCKVLPTNMETSPHNKRDLNRTGVL